MTIRIIVEQVDTGAAAAGVPGAKTQVSHRTFDIDATELEAFLRNAPNRFVIGAELLGVFESAVRRGEER